MAKTDQRNVAFSATKRKEEREAEIIEIGGVDFVRRFKDWDVQNEVQEILRRQGKAQQRAEGHRESVARLYDEAAAEGRDVDEAKVDELFSAANDARLESDGATFELIAELLKGPEDQRPEVEFLKKHLDIEDIGALTDLLLARRESAGPTPTTDTPTTPSS